LRTNASAYFKGMKKTIIIALVLGLLAAGGWWLLAARHNSRQANMEKFESDLTENLVDEIMQENDAVKPQRYFLAFGEERTDPSRLFIARFARHFPPVRGISSSVMTRNGQVTETANGRAGVFIQILRVKKNLSGTFDVLVAFPKLPAGENRFVYRMANDNGKWSLIGKSADASGS
jgi:hypothetical protein